MSNLSNYNEPQNVPLKNIEVVESTLVATRTNGETFVRNLPTQTPGIDLNTAVPQTLVLDDVFTHLELTSDNNDWYEDPSPAEDRLVADTNRALPRGTVGDVVGTMSDNGNDGVYVIIDLGEDGVSPWVLERHPDFNTVETMFRNMVFKVGGGRSVYSVAWDPEADPQSVNFSDYSYAISPSHAEGASSHAEGASSHAEGVYSHAEGYISHAEGGSSHAEGGFSHAEGHYSHAEGGGQFDTPGSIQSVSLQVSAKTADATPTSLKARYYDTEAPVHADRVMAVRALVSARKIDGTLGAAWMVTAAVRTDASKNCTVLGTPVVTSLGSDAGAAAWSVAFSTATGVIRLIATGAAATNIRWAAKLEYEEVG